jgi:hypothetical protein
MRNLTLGYNFRFLALARTSSDFPVALCIGGNEMQDLEIHVKVWLLWELDCSTSRATGDILLNVKMQDLLPLRNNGRATSASTSSRIQILVRTLCALSFPVLF